MAEDVEVTGNEEGLTKVQKLWKEVKEWKSNWKWTTFLNALVLGLAASLFDSVTDFNFAWSVPEDCRNTTDSSVKPFDKVYVSSPCGLLYYKNVERLTSLCRRSGLNPSSPVTGIFFHEPSSVSLRCREMIVSQIFV